MIEQSLIIGINPEYVIQIVQHMGDIGVIETGIKTGKNLHQVVCDDNLIALKKTLLLLKEGNSTTLNIKFQNSDFSAFNGVRVTKNTPENNQMWALLHFYKKTQIPYCIHFDEKTPHTKITGTDYIHHQDAFEFDPVIHLNIAVGSGEIIDCNQLAVEKLGFDHKGEIIGKSISEFVAKKSRTKCIKLIRKFKKNGFIRDEEIKLKHKNKKEIYVRIYVLTERDSEGNVLIYRATLVDITDLKKIQRNLRRKKDYLQDLNNQLEQIISICSHDLQEPLATIKFSADILQKQHGHLIGKQSSEYLSYINQAVDRLSSQIRHILLRSAPKQKKPSDINSILQIVLKDLQKNIIESDAEIHIQKSIPIIKAYPTDLRLLFQNLIANAINHRKPGSVPKIDLSFTEHDNYLQFQIKDNAVGIHKKYHKKIFKYFKPLNSINLGGIGLYHCKKIVDKHQGKIWVESQEDQGSIFKFTIAK